MLKLAIVLKENYTQKSLKLRIFVSKPRLGGAIQLVCSSSRKPDAEFREPLDKPKLQPALQRNVFMFYTPIVFNTRQSIGSFLQI